MATSRNEFTGAKLQTRPATQAYYSGWDAIFAPKTVVPAEDEVEGVEPEVTPEETPVESV